MARTNRSRNVHVVRTEQQRTPEQLRRVGRALIALARAQLEAEAEATHAKADTADLPAPKTPATRTTKPRRSA